MDSPRNSPRNWSDVPEDERSGSFEGVGIFSDVPRAVYDAWPGINKSTLYRLLEETPGHYRYLLDHPEQAETAGMCFGRRIHQALLEPAVFARTYVRSPDPPSGDAWDRRYKDHKAAWDAWMAAQNEGVEILSQTAYDALITARDGWLQNDYLRELLEVGFHEVSVQWHDKRTGLLCKARLDLYFPADGRVMDLKTCQSAAHHTFMRQCLRNGSYLQMAFYCDGVRAVAPTEETPDNVPVFLALEKKPVGRARDGVQPWGVAFRKIPWIEIERFRYDYEAALGTLQNCLETDEWPAYPQREVHVPVPEFGTSPLAAYDEPRPANLHEEEDDAVIPY